DVVEHLPQCLVVVLPRLNPCGEVALHHRRFAGRTGSDIDHVQIDGSLVNISTPGNEQVTQLNHIVGSNRYIVWLRHHASLSFRSGVRPSALSVAPASVQSSSPMSQVSRPVDLSPSRPRTPP